jgi:hypothetical protein
VGDAGGWGGILFFGIEEKWHKLVDSRHGNVSSVVSGKKGLSLEVEEEDRRCHFEETIRRHAAPFDDTLV